MDRPAACSWRGARWDRPDGRPCSLCAAGRLPAADSDAPRLPARAGISPRRLVPRRAGAARNAAGGDRGARAARPHCGVLAGSGAARGVGRAERRPGHGDLRRPSPAPGLAGRRAGGAGSAVRRGLPVLAPHRGRRPRRGLSRRRGALRRARLRAGAGPRPGRPRRSRRARRRGGDRVEQDRRPARGARRRWGGGDSAASGVALPRSPPDRHARARTGAAGDPRPMGNPLLGRSRGAAGERRGDTARSAGSTAGAASARRRGRPAGAEAAADALRGDGRASTTVSKACSRSSS